MKRSSIILGVVAVLVLVGISQSAFVVDETERAIVLQLGKPIGETLGPGLHFKLPFVQNALFFDARILDYEAKAAEILTKDKKTMVVDNYSRWRITDPLLFYRTLRTEQRAQARLEDIIYAELRVVLGRFSLHELVSEKRAEIMSLVTAKTNEMLSPYGLEVVDVRIKRTDLPPQNEQAIFNRMRSERIREAKLYRSEGQEEMDKIKSGADRERTIILAEAQRKADVLRGEGDAEAAAIFAEALRPAREFYSFVRSLDAYKAATMENTRVILTPSGEFLKYMR
ncbi:protease modulator HflC [Desulfolutivibrio sulfoxidireducens]|uniref:protease modulator HflC n=1 Tax=Desulfolutivibrio sulfoxidireducens TaxID=2773299 RepID=UPI00159DD0B9|nr:protease modulator HflC [Desulfolutivibrio sulfoxidireducens]QLA17767.1 protease modulator HflC [Desulfolutivibrio sulfoxidireducens]QLA21344.1 protease modulator HflC [Desulfolutivibrio sulfoxidireducens]